MPIGKSGPTLADGKYNIAEFFNEIGALRTLSGWKRRG
jgi:hypothetical protein